jgi:hypothetical protein
MEQDLKTRMLKILAVTALLIFSIQSFSDNKADVDLWGNVGFVKALPWSPEFNLVNTFSFTDPQHRWINHEWLAEYIFNKIHNTIGNPGLLGIKILLGLVIALLLARQVMKDCGTPVLQFLFLALTISTMGYGFSIRPHLFTYLMLALFLTLLKNHAHRQPLSLLLLPVIGIIWVNLHGAFFTGIILVAIYMLSEYAKLIHSGSLRQEKLFAFILPATCILLAAASLLNPYGPRLWNFIFESAATSRPYLSEWAPFNPVSGFWAHSDFMALSAVAFASLFLSRKPKDPTWICILAVAFVAALTLRRNIPIFAMVACYVVPEHLDDIARRPFEGIARQIPAPVTTLLLAALIILSAFYTFKVKKANPLEIEVPRDRFPVDAVSFIKTIYVAIFSSSSTGRSIASGSSTRIAAFFSMDGLPTRMKEKR